MLLLGEKLEGKFTIQYFGVAYLQKMAVCEQCVVQSRFFQVTQYKRMRFWWLNTRFESSNQWQSISEKRFVNKVSFWWLNAYNFFFTLHIVKLKDTLDTQQYWNNFIICM